MPTLGPLETASTAVPRASLDQYYRFALLLCGNAKGAERVLGSALAEMRRHTEQLRNAQARQAWLVTRLRQECKRLTTPKPAAGAAPGLVRSEEDLAENPELLTIEAYLLAQRFSCLPEPGRTALALLYLDLFPPAELPKLLELSWDRVCTALAEARLELQKQIAEMRSPEAVSA